MASNGNSLLSNEATIKTTISEAIDCLESHTDIHCSETPPPSKAARLSINDGEQIKLINNNLEDGEINNIELEYKNITATRNGWNRLYQEIRGRCEQEAKENNFTTSESEKSQNRSLNRYRDVNPYDHSRIALQRGNVDYINANLVELKRADRKYILTQGPLSNTVGHFWLMVWEHNTKAILMLNKLMEKKQVKCFMYWPECKGVENSLILNDVKLRVQFIHCEQYKNYYCRWFKLSDMLSGQSREVLQFHYTTWPDFGIPSSPVAFLQFLKQVRDSGALDIDYGPAVVHCSAGIGRSGTFCLVDCCLVLVEKEAVQNVSVQEILYELRKYRMGLIQTPDQLYFSYQAIIKGIKILKDPDFINYNEIPIKMNNDVVSEGNQIHYPNNLNATDEVPPPLPPRTHSLISPMILSNGGNQKSMNQINDINKNETISNNKAVDRKVNIKKKLDFNINDGIDPTSIDKNIVNHSDHDNIMSDIPLPPLPDHIAEHDNNDNEDDNEDKRERDVNEYYNDDTDAESDTDSHKVIKQNNINQKIYEKKKRMVDCKNNDINQNNSFENDDNNAKETTSGSHSCDKMKLNGVEGGAATPTKDITINEIKELRQRSRNERQKRIKQKVIDIKRKQKENFQSNHFSKRGKTLITCLTAGFVVGVVCVYAYSKWN